MIVVPRDLELSLRRAPDRERVLVYLSLVESATLGELAAETGIRPARIIGIMEGLAGQYARDLSLTAQRAARAVHRRGARRYQITPAGRAAARETLERLGG